MPGIDGARCGSLARIGLPVEVREPASTQEFEPMPLPAVPRRDGSAASPARTASSAGRARGNASAAGALGPDATNAPAATVPDDTIGALRSYGYGGYSCPIWSRVSPSASSVARSISSVMLPRRSHAIALSQERLSTGVHFSMRYPLFRKPRIVYSRLTAPLASPSPCWRSHSLTPSAYADRYSRVCGASRSHSRSATRRQPSVRRYVSVDTWSGPNSSASRPAVTWRRKSISQKRSWACTYPWARNRSSAVEAYTCGTA